MSAINQYYSNQNQYQQLVDCNQRIAHLQNELQMLHEQHSQISAALPHDHRVYDKISKLQLINNTPLHWFAGTNQLGRIINPANGKEVIVRRNVVHVYDDDIKFCLMVTDLKFDGDYDEVVADLRCRWNYAEEDFRIGGYQVDPYDKNMQSSFAYVKDRPSENKSISASYTALQFRDMIANNNYYIGM